MLIVEMGKAKVLPLLELFPWGLVREFEELVVVLENQGLVLELENEG